MSWQPNWQGGPRGTFQRGRAANEEGEENEARAEDGEMEEEGEIAPSAPMRNLHPKHAEFNGPQLRGGGRGGPNNPRFGGPSGGGPRERPRPRNNFSGMTSPRMPPSGTGFQAGKNNGPSFQRDMMQQPPASNPFRQDSYGDAQGNREKMDTQTSQPRSGGAREYRDFNSGLPPPNGPRKEPGPPYGGRDFRNDSLPPKRDFDGPTRPPRDFRGDMPGARDFRNGPDIGRNFRNDRDYRDRSDGPPNRDFRPGNPPPIRDIFGRERVGNVPLHRENSIGSSFGPGGQRDVPFRDRDNHFRDGPNRDGQFHDGPKREPPFRDNGPRIDPQVRDSFAARDHPGKHGPFSSRGPPTRDTGHGGYHRDAKRGVPDEVMSKPRNNSGAMMQVGNIASQAPSFSPSLQKNTIGQIVHQQHKLRPTDPRRRASNGAAASPFVAKPKAMDMSNDPRRAHGPPPSGVGSSAFNSIPPPSHPPRRLSSYSSLADGSVPGPTHLKSGDMNAMEGTHNRQGSGMRSPAPPRRQWVDRGRNPIASHPSSPTKVIMQQNVTSSARPPVAPSLRPSNNANDPRSRQSEKGGDAGVSEKDSIPLIPKRGREWKDRPFSNHIESSTPRGSPINQKSIRKLQNEGSAQAPSKLVANKSGTTTGERSKPLPASEAITKSKPEQPVPLRTALLGDDSVVRRAKAAMLHLGEVIPSHKKSGKDCSVLPSKQAIMSAVKEIEKKIKESQKECITLTADKESAEILEETEREEEAARLVAAEKKRKEELENAAEEEKNQYEIRRAAELKKAMEGCKSRIAEAKEKFEKEFQLNLSERKEDKKKKLEEEIETEMAKVSICLDKDITNAKGDLGETESARQKIESKIAVLESEYQTALQKKGARSDQQLASTELVSKKLDLIQSITLQNRRNAAEASMFSFSLVADSANVEDETETKLQAGVDPKFNKTNIEWSKLATNVASLDEALFADPVDVPYYEQGDRNHSVVGPTVKEYIRDKQDRLVKQWIELAEEYEVRKRLFERQQKKLAKKGQQRGSLSMGGRSSILGNKKTRESAGLVRGANILESTGRNSNNPYRRARRGNEVRSEYEQEQIIAEIAAKEAMEKRITHGGCKVPRQLCHLERQVTASYVETFTAQKIDDPVSEEEKASRINVWTDMEKCIFLDRFLQFPKDFRRIATFLRNKTTKDCVAFYYDSKQAVPYKGALKEHVMRRKRKGDYQVWDSSIQAAISVGAVVAAGTSEEVPVSISLPASDCTFATRMLHPFKLQALDCKGTEKMLDGLEAEGLHIEDPKPKSRKRNRDPLFSLGKEHTKFLRIASQESMTASQLRSAIIGEGNIDSLDKHKENDTFTSGSKQGRKAPQKWTSAEKKIFVATLEEHGRDWARLSDAVGTKSISQIKNFYYDYKKQSGKHRTVEKKMYKQTFSSQHREDCSEDRSLLGKDQEDEVKVTIKRGRGEVGLQNQEENGDKEAATPQDPRETSGTKHHEQVEQPGEHGNAELIKHLLSQQLQQQQQLGHQRMQLNQQPQSALQQLLTQQHHQRDHHQALGQLSLEDAHRLLQQHQSSHQQHILSHLVPWLSASQLLQTQSRIQQAQAAAALQQQENGQLSSVSDIADVAKLQRLLQMHQVNQNPFGIGQPNRSQLHSLLLSNAGLNSPGGSTLPTSNQAMNQSANLLTQLEKLSQQQGSSASSESATENLAAFAGAQRLLGFGNSLQGTGASNSNVVSSSIPGGLGLGLGAQATNVDARGMSGALNMLASNLGSYNGMPDRQDGGADRYNQSQP